MNERLPSPEGGGLGRGGNANELPPHPAPSGATLSQWEREIRVDETLIIGGANGET
jgi:hypothetical protein